MSTQKAKFELFSRLQNLGFTYDEAAALRRIEMTLQRWGERECGDGSNWGIERDEETGKPFNVFHGDGKPRRYAIADREAGALRRLQAIVSARNSRYMQQCGAGKCPEEGFAMAYHQSDPRGCALYIVERSALPKVEDAEILRHSGPSAVKSAEARLEWALSCYYTRGIAVCA